MMKMKKIMRKKKKMKNNSWKDNNILNESLGYSLYDEVCRVLTDYEHNGEEETGGEVISAEDFNEIFYDVLCKVQEQMAEELN